MNRWVDVTEDDWFYNEVMEATNIILEDGTPLVSGIAYNKYNSDAPYVYEEQKVGTSGKKVFTLPSAIIPTKTNPLYVFMDGVQLQYKKTTVNGTTTDVELYTAPKVGVMMTFIILGKPYLDRFKKPSMENMGEYPSKKLDYGDTYFYSPFSRKNVEYLHAFGRPLRRLTVPDEEWTADNGQTIAKKYIGGKNDVYIVSPKEYGGWIYLPYNLNGVTCTFSYNSIDADGDIVKRGGEFKASTDRVLFMNRFFPDALIDRSEAFVLIDKLRRTLYSRFTDQDAPTNVLDQTVYTYEGQVAFKLNGYYDVGKGLVVKVFYSPSDPTDPGTTLTSGYHYTEIDSHSVVMKFPLAAGLKVTFHYEKTVSERFKDVGTLTQRYNYTTGEVTTVNGLTAPSGTYQATWWSQPVVALEGERLQDGTYMIAGIAIDNFHEPEHAVIVDNMNNPQDSNIPGAPKELYFMPDVLLDRAAAVTFLNRFIKWSIEKFK